MRDNPELDKGLIGRRWDKQCENQTTEVQKYIAESNPIFIAASWKAFSLTAMRQVKQFIQNQTSQGKHVIVLAEIPTLKINPVRALHFQDIDIPSWAYMRSNGILSKAPKLANAKLRDELGNIPGYLFMDLTDVPLFRNPPYYDGNLMYFNPNHLNEAGSLAYGEQAAERIMAAIASNAQ